MTDRQKVGGVDWVTKNVVIDTRKDQETKLPWSDMG